MPSIRAAKIDDLPAITEIYNEAVKTTVATFDTEPKTVDEQKKWFEHHGSRHPVLVAELDGVVVGWSSLSRWSDRYAYAETGEISLYVKEPLRGRGIGKKLLMSVIEEGEKAGLHTVIARIAQGNGASIHIHTLVGFEQIGVMREVGRKFGRRIDVHLMQKIYHGEDVK